jgi:hypothetical protein
MTWVVRIFDNWLVVDQDLEPSVPRSMPKTEMSGPLGPDDPGN